MTYISNNPGLAARAIESLKSVYDPELGLNVVDLGLIYQLDFDESNRTVYVQMTLTTRFCPMGDSITMGVRQAMEMAFLGYAIDLQLSFEPPWTSALISEEGKKQLGR